MTPVSNEKRELIIAAKKRGDKESEIAIWLNISKSSVGKIWKLYRDTGSYFPAPYPGRQSILTPAKWNEVIELVAASPDKTLDEIIEELSLPIHKSWLSVLLIKAGYSFKKRQFILPHKTARMFKKRERGICPSDKEY
jgi:transposase